MISNVVIPTRRKLETSFEDFSTQESMLTNNIHMNCRKESIMIGFSKERQFLKDDPGEYMVMFVGDRGEEVGSRVKGFLKYSGRWKSMINSRYCSVCFTNEYNT